MKILYADAWMVQALASAGVAATTLLDLPQLLDTLSVEDVAFYVRVNKNLPAFIPAPIVNSFTPVVFDLSDIHSQPGTRRIKDVVQALDITGKPAVPADASDPSKILTCDLLGADTIVFKHISKAGAVINELEHTQHFLDRIIRQMSVIEPFERVAIQPVMRYYLETRAEQLKPNRVV